MFMINASNTAFRNEYEVAGRSASFQAGDSRPFTYPLEVISLPLPAQHQSPAAFTGDTFERVEQTWRKANKERSRRRRLLGFVHLFDQTAARPEEDGREQMRERRRHSINLPQDAAEQVRRAQQLALRDDHKRDLEKAKFRYLALREINQFEPHEICRRSAADIVDAHDKDRVADAVMVVKLLEKLALHEDDPIYRFVDKDVVDKASKTFA